MFDLEKEINAWCRSVHPFGFNRNAKIEELKDHLFSAVEYYQAEGLSEKESFFRATGRLGQVDELTKEHAKNRSLVMNAAHQLQEFESAHIDKWSDSMSGKTVAILNIVVALVFAAAILLASYFQVGESNQMTTNILIALWFIPFSVLTAISGKKQGKKKVC